MASSAHQVVCTCNVTLHGLQKSGPETNLSDCDVGSFDAFVLVVQLPPTKLLSSLNCRRWSMVLLTVLTEAELSQELALCCLLFWYAGGGVGT